MKAFYRHQGDIIKAYDMGDDWKITYGASERWFSKWKGKELDSLCRAFHGIVGEHLDESKIVIVRG